MTNSIIVNGSGYGVDFTVKSYANDPKLRISDRLCRPRDVAPTIICLHTWTGDDPQERVDGPVACDPEAAGKLVDGWETDARTCMRCGVLLAVASPKCPDHTRGNPHSAHALVTADGTCHQLCDFGAAVSYHARNLNARSIGIEIQDPKSALGVHQLSRAALETVGKLCDALALALGIQRQFCRYDGGDVARLVAGGAGFVGACGHRDRGDHDDRSRWDPGDLPFVELARIGWEGFDAGQLEDVHVWRERQRALGFAGDDVDGVPGPMTRAALERAGYVRGIWTLGKRA